jgi:hypothetical protein
MGEGWCQSTVLQGSCGASKRQTGGEGHAGTPLGCGGGGGGVVCVWEGGGGGGVGRPPPHGSASTTAASSCGYNVAHWCYRSTGVHVGIALKVRESHESDAQMAAQTSQPQKTLRLGGG